jgi:potassium/hydrogen antiporter
MVLAPSAQAVVLDELFAERPASDDRAGSFGAFTFDGELPIGKLADFYDLPVPEEQRAMPLADFVGTRLHGQAQVGDRIQLADIELVVRALRDDRITEVGIDLEPRPTPRPSLAQLRVWLRGGLARLRGARP